MATISGDRRLIEARSGGKIVRNRRMEPRRTPYDRPSITPKPPTESPSWFVSATRLISTGAGKLLSSVFTSESSSSSESSSCEDLSSDDVANESESDEINSQEDERADKENETPLEMIQYFRKDHQPKEGTSDAKHVIERLLMQETFSREEGDRMISIIRSRVSNVPIAEKDQLNGSGICSSAVMEAQKWLEEKKLGSSSKSDLDLGTCSLNSAMLPYYVEREIGSPVDVAKSYMRLRPPWASPSAQTPSPVMIDLVSQETPPSIADSYLSSSKLKRNSLASGSWNISEEIRKVRAKASEDLLGSLPSSNIDWSSISLEPKSKPITVTTSTTEIGLNTVQDGLRNEGLSSTPALLASEQNQDVEAIHSIEGKQASIPGSGSKEQTGSKSSLKGISSAGPSLSTGLDPKPDKAQSEGQHSNPNNRSSHEKLPTSAHDQDTNELLSEATVQVPLTNGSQNSSSMQYEELGQNLKRKAGAKKVSSRYNKRGRGRGI